MQFSPFPNAPPNPVTVTDVSSALEVIRAAVHRGVGVILNYDPSQFIVGLHGQAPGPARQWVEMALEQLLAHGTDLERAYVLGALAISDNDWRLATVKRLVMQAPDWLTEPNPRHNQRAPLGRLLVEAALGRVVHLYPEIVPEIEKHAAAWGGATHFLQWSVKRDPDGSGVDLVEAFAGDLSSVAGILGIVFASRPESILLRVAAKVRSATTPEAAQDFMWSVEDHCKDKAVVSRVANALGLPAS